MISFPTLDVVGTEIYASSGERNAKEEIQAIKIFVPSGERKAFPARYGRETKFLSLVGLWSFFLAT